MANISYGVNIIPKTNNTYTLGNSDYKWSNIYSVALNGTPISSTGYATTSAAGLIKVGSGLYINDGELLINKATDTQIKNSTNGYTPIVPTTQHKSVFYGLATAAGDTTQSSSSNNVGVYTEDAKIAIQKMLGIYEAPWELIRSDTITHDTEADVEITVDDDGNSFELTDIIVQMVLGSATVQTTFNDYGRIRYYYGTSSSAYNDTIANGNVTVNAGSNKGLYSCLEQKHSMIRMYSTGAVSTGSSASMLNFTTTNFSSEILPYTIITTPRYYDKIVFKKITGTIKFKIYGKRKWT